MWGNIDEIFELIVWFVVLVFICKVLVDELCQFSGVSYWQDVCYYLCDLGCDIMIILLGVDGVLLIIVEGEFYFFILCVDVVDIIGVGDVFVGGLLFIFFCVNCWDYVLLVEVISNVNVCGVMVVMVKGVMIVLLFFDQFNIFLFSYLLV